MSLDVCVRGSRRPATPHSHGQGIDVTKPFHDFCPHEQGLRRSEPKPLFHFFLGLYTGFEGGSDVVPDHSSESTLSSGDKNSGTGWEGLTVFRPTVDGVRGGVDMSHGSVVSHSLTSREACRGAVSVSGTSPSPLVECRSIRLV